uniref:Uncharacterized protein n=1 Tax=Scylla olivacea TaxID=85551 RepID=A0A0P4W1H3_SCYOL
MDWYTEHWNYEDYLKEKNPKVVCLTETKLKEENQIVINNNYNIWRRDRIGKGGRGVMIMRRKESKTKIVKYGEGKAEIVSVNLEDNNGEILMVITTCVPPKTNSWSKEDYEKIIEDTIQCLSKLIRSSKKVLLRLVTSVAKK